MNDLRAVCIGGGARFTALTSQSSVDIYFIEPSEAAAIVPARIAFSVPIVTAYPSPLAAGPVFASHPLDMQVLDGGESNDSESAPAKTHTGAPTCNVEIKLLNIAEEAVEGGADPEGEVSFLTAVDYVVLNACVALHPWPYYRRPSSDGRAT